MAIVIMKYRPYSYTDFVHRAINMMVIITENIFLHQVFEINALKGQMIGQNLTPNSYLHAMISTHIFNFECIDVENLTANFLSVH